MPLQRLLLSGSTGGTPVVLQYYAQSPYSNIVHTTDVSTSIIDEIYVYVVNPSTNAAEIQIAFGDGGGTYPGPYTWSQLTVPAKSITLVVNGVNLSGTGSAGRELRMAYVSGAGGTSNNVTFLGYVNRIS